MPSSPFASRRRFLASAGGLALAGLSAGARADEFEPQLGRIGKDVMWLPTPDLMIERLLRMAGARPEDRLIDLGSGDGRFVIAAARDFGLPARGVEYDPKMVDYASQLAKSEGVADKVRFERGDVFETDFSDATIVAMYLLPTINLRLRPKLLAMPPGTRIVTHAFDMGEWQADEKTVVERRDGYLWIVPANAGGAWQADAGEGGAPVTFEFTQTFQRVHGVARFGETTTSLRDARLSGRQLAFAYTDQDGILRAIEATLDGDTLSGRSRSAQGEQPFAARRMGPAPAIGGSGEASDEEMRAAAAFLGEM